MMVRPVTRTRVQAKPPPFALLTTNRRGHRPARGTEGPEPSEGLVVDLPMSETARIALGSPAQDSWGWGPRGPSKAAGIE